MSYVKLKVLVVRVNIVRIVFKHAEYLPKGVAAHNNKKDQRSHTPHFRLEVSLSLIKRELDGLSEHISLCNEVREPVLLLPLLKHSQNP